MARYFEFRLTNIRLCLCLLNFEICKSWLSWWTLDLVSTRHFLVIMLGSVYLQSTVLVMLWRLDVKFIADYNLRYWRFALKMSSSVVYELLVGPFFNQTKIKKKKTYNTGKMKKLCATNDAVLHWNWIFFFFIETWCVRIIQMKEVVKKMMQYPFSLLRMPLVDTSFCQSCIPYHMTLPCYSTRT